MPELQGACGYVQSAQRFNVSDVNPLHINAGQISAASDPRQFRSGLRLTW